MKFGCLYSLFHLLLMLLFFLSLHSGLLCFLSRILISQTHGFFEELNSLPQIFLEVVAIIVHNSQIVVAGCVSRLCCQSIVCVGFALITFLLAVGRRSYHTCWLSVVCSLLEVSHCLLLIPLNVHQMVCILQVALRKFHVCGSFTVLSAFGKVYRDTDSPPIADS